MAEQLLIIDVHNYLFRAFHAIAGLRSRSGMATNAVYGLAGSLCLLRETYPQAAVAAVMDAPGKTFRHDLFPDYKANRAETDEDLKVQIEPGRQLIEALGMQLYCVAQVEADDVIASLAVAAAGRGQQVVIATSDKDLMYLAGTGARIHDPKRNLLFDAAGVAERYKVQPGQMADYLALVGDSSDNIPGVPGIGPKRAADLLAAYGNLDAIIANADQVKGKMGESLRATIPQLPLIRKLVAVREDIPLQPDPQQLARPQVQPEKLELLCQRLQFNPDLQARLAVKPASAPAAAEIPVAIIETDAQATDAAAQIAKTSGLGIHIESAGADAPSRQLVGLAVATAERGWYLPVAHGTGADEENEQPQPVNAPAAAVATVIAAVAGRGEQLAAFAVKDAWHCLPSRGEQLAGCIDTQLLSYSINSDAAGSLAALLRHNSLPAAADRTGLLKKKNRPLAFAQLPTRLAATAAAGWAAATAGLKRKLMMAATGAQLDIYDRIERPLLPVLADMEQTGIMIDEPRLAQLSEKLQVRMDENRQRVEEAAGEQINLNSPAQLAKLLFDQLGLTAGRKTSQGKLSTNEAELERLARTGKSPVPGWILEYRQAAKLHGTYTAALPKRINPDTGRIHTTFIQTGAVTGRLSSVDPNLQNIPVRTEIGQLIRRSFIAAPGKVLVAADYSQIELRILAHFSGDRTLAGAFAAGEDIHSRTAAEVFATDPAAVTAEQRRFAKTINFGLIYGMGAFGLAQRLAISQSQARELIERYFARLPGVSSYLDQLKKQASEERFVETACGRKISVAPVAGTRAARAHALRAATNAPMQGTAADIMKLAMIEIDRRLRQKKFAARMLLQVHDELVFEAPENEFEPLAALLTEVMTGVVKLKVPLAVDIGRGANWDEAR